jgi:hypothetical protein
MFDWSKLKHKWLKPLYCLCSIAWGIVSGSRCYYRLWALSLSAMSWTISLESPMQQWNLYFFIAKVVCQVSRHLLCDKDKEWANNDMIKRFRLCCTSKHPCNTKFCERNNVLSVCHTCQDTAEQEPSLFWICHQTQCDILRLNLWERLCRMQTGWLTILSISP